MCVPKKPRMKRTIAATSFANHPPPPVSAAWTPKYAIANPTPIINVRWQRGPHRATMLNFFDSGSMSCNPAAPGGMISSERFTSHSQRPFPVDSPSLISGYASKNDFGSRLIRILQSSILGLWLRATHAEVTPACHQTISSPQTYCIVTRTTCSNLFPRWFGCGRLGRNLVNLDGLPVHVWWKRK